MRIKTILLVALAGFTVLSSCKRNSVSLSFTTAKDEVPLLTNLVFRFNQPLVKDSMLNAWDSAGYIRFEPDIKGRFRWESPDELVFSPSEPLRPATTYKATITSAVLKFSKYNNIKNADKLSFHTPGLTLENSMVTWIGESSTTAFPQLELFFNYKVVPADLKDKLKIEVEGKETAYTLLTASPDEKISVRLNGLKAEDKDFDSRVIIAKGLKPDAGGNATGEELSTSLSIPSPWVLSVLNVEAEHDETEGTVTVTTSQQLSDANIRSFIRFDPSVEFTAEPTDNGFILRSSKFDVEKSYTLTVNNGLRGKIGGVLKEDYNRSVAFGELEANINFTNDKAVYLSKKGAKNLEVQITSVPKVKIIISKIYENNLLLAQRYGYAPQEISASANEEGDYEGEYAYNDGGDAILGDVVYEKEIDTRTLPKSGAGRLLNFSQFEDRLPDFNGIYHVVIRSTQDYWVRDSRFISLSDLGLIAKEGAGKIFVFTNSLKTAAPVSGVNISIYAANNQLIGTGATNGEGVAEVSCAQKEFNGFKPAMIIAKTADDFNYLPFRNTRVNTSRFSVGGKRNNPSGFDAFVYAERDIYRPGEKINFSLILRDNKWQSPGEIPLKLKFLMPNGKELKTFRKSLNEEGSMESSIDISTAAITGSYTLEIYTSNDVLLASKNFSVEEFVPDRIRVSASLSKTGFKPGEDASLAINAMNFFGPPAANRNIETEIQVKQRNFSPEKFEDYDFSLGNLTGFYDKVVKEAKTDASGNAIVNYQVPADYANSGLLQANFYTTVFDETGRPVNRATTADIYTQEVFFGIKRDWYFYAPLNQPVKFLFAAVKKDGNGTSAAAKLELIKHEYRTVLTKSGSNFRYESQKVDKIMTDATLTIGSNSAWSYVPRSPGDYELRLYQPGANSYVSRSFYSYGSYGDANTSFSVNTEGNIDIQLDKKSYFAGESVTALFKTPFSGKMLVTLETDHVLSYQYVEVNNRDASVTLPLNSEDVPNVYITATLIKPHEMSEIPLTVAHGFQNIKVEEKSRRIPVELVASKSVRSRTHQKVTVKAAPGSYVTLAAVDNGILQVSDYKTPDPYNYFYQQKALQVNAYDLYPLLFAEIRGRLSSTGGDGDLAMDKRVNPVQAKRVKMVSYWGGIKIANGSGNAEFEFDVPAFSGELRLMAVSYKGNRFGALDQTMTVADPIVLSTALPRFLSPGDTVNVPVTLSNTTDKTTSVTAGITVQGPIKIMGGNSQKVDLAAKSEGRATFRIVADASIAAGQVTITVNGLGEKFTDITEIAVRPPSTLQKMTGSGSIAGGGSQKINIGVSDFIPGSTSYSLVVSRSPALELADQLRYLVQYPYGCTEQTVSAAFPQLYFGDMADLMQLNRSGDRLNANTNIMEAIRKIKMRQLYNGALVLWDGGGTEDWWSTIYAAHFLIEARRAGFEVDGSLLETMLNYINNRLKKKETVTYYYNRNQTKKIAPKEVAYGLYVLALAGRTNIPSMNYYKANTAVLALDSRYLLSAAYAAAGDRKSFNTLLPSAFTGEESVPQTGGSFYSDIRDEAIALNALIDADPANAQIPVMAKHVSTKLRSRTWMSTQERAFAFLALGKLARSANQSDVTAAIQVNGKTIAKVESGQWRGDANALGGTGVEISTKGNGRLYYFWQSEGISASGTYKEEDSYLKVRRHFFDRNGNPISGNTFRQNDLVVIGITVEKAFSTSVDNVVITDLLPAGFEIENPRTKEIPGMDWIKDGATPVALDVRDDRIHFFINVNGSKQTYYYAVRAVSPGNFKMGPVSADAMYNGEYHSYNGAGIIRVIQ